MKPEIKKYYYSTGQLMYETPYRNGQIHGIEKHYHPFGQLSWEIPYRNGQRHGLCKEWNETEKEKEKKQMRPPDRIQWYMYGVPVTEKEFKMPPEEVDIEKCILKETNVQRRMAFLQKVGIDRVFSKLKHEVKDTYKLGNNPNFPYDEYTLVLIEINNKMCPYLKMRNASMGVFHLEGVDPKCKTAKEAFEWRYHNKIKGEEVRGMA